MVIETLFQYNRAELLHLLRISRRRWSRGRYLGAVSLLAVGGPPMLPVLIRGILIGAGLALALLTELRLHRSAWLAARRERGNPRTLTVTDQAFSSRSGTRMRCFVWEEMHAVRRKKDCWYLDFPESRFLLPARAFSDEQRAEFEKLLLDQGWGTPAG